MIIEGIFLPYRPSKIILTDLEIAAQIIIKARTRVLTTAGREFSTTHLPLKKDYFNWAMEKSKDLLIALLGLSRCLHNSFPIAQGVAVTNMLQGKSTNK